MSNKTKLKAAFEELLKFGQHAGPCGFDGECPECGTKTGSCKKHQEAMERRIEYFEDRMDALVLETEKPRSLIWNKGPALGGTGNAGNRADNEDWWQDATLLVIVETVYGRDIAVINVSADEGGVSATFNDTGDGWGWEVSDIAWFAVLGENLPEKTD